MPVVSPSRVGAPPATVCLPPRRNRLLETETSHECVPARVSMLFQRQDKKQLSTFRAEGIGLPRLVATRSRSITLDSKSRKPVFACNAALNAKCSQGQTQTVTRKTPTITQAPIHGKEKSLRLDDGGNGFPPRDDGGGGGGGGGDGENFSGGFYLFGFLMLMGFLKDLEGEHDGRGNP